MKYLIGTLFEEEQIKQKTQFDNMKAKDQKGHMRWQGAFTGGFTAGYKNTCGSKDGWAPATFVSSRDKRAGQVRQDISAFMDQEDIGKSKLAENIQIINKFASKIGDNPFNISIQQSIGQTILNKLKKVKAQQYQPKDEQQVEKLFQKYAKQQQIEKDHLAKYYNLRDKDNYCSLGYNQIEEIQDNFLNQYNEIFNQVMRNKWKQQSEQQKRKKKQQNKIYFDFTKPEEQQEDYLKQIVEFKNQQKEPHKKVKLQIFKIKLDQLFFKHSKIKQNQRQIKIPQVPLDYDPYHKLKNINKIKIKQQPIFHKKLNIQSRKNMLGQKTIQQRVSGNNQKFVKAQQNLTNVQPNVDLDYQLMDPKKQMRYQGYVLQMEGKLISGNNQDMDWKAAEKQRQQFQKIYKKTLNKKINGASQMAKTFQVQRQKKKVTVELDKIIRTKSSWRPQRLLCKRFGLLTPYEINREERDE